MDWTTIGVGAAVVVAVLVLRRVSLIGRRSARQWLAKGAKVIDVRSSGEFRERSLPGAINIPLGRLQEEVARVFPDRNQPLLLHCLGGGRSALGRRFLKRLGYRNVFNLGSYSRAARVLGAQL